MRLKSEMRPCAQCGAEFLAKKSSKTGQLKLYCGKVCQGASKRGKPNGQRGKKRGPQSPELIAKRAAAIKLASAKPEVKARRSVAMKAAIARAMADPEKRAARSAASSAWMTSLHQDPEFQARRNVRSSRVMKANWQDPKIREVLMAHAAEQGGRHLQTPQAIAKKTAANRWILKNVLAERGAATNYNEKFAETLERVRREMPYDGPQEHSDYQEYCSRVSHIVGMDPHLRRIHDEFVKEAIPRWAALWQERKKAA